jgi:hypothetical protein
MDSIRSNKSRASTTASKLEAELGPILLRFVRRYGRVEVLIAAKRLLYVEARGRREDQNTSRRVHAAYALMREAALAGERLHFETAARLVAEKDKSQSVDATVKTMRRLHTRLSRPPAMLDRQALLRNLDKTGPCGDDIFFGLTAGPRNAKE